MPVCLLASPVVNNRVSRWWSVHKVLFVVLRSYYSKILECWQVIHEGPYELSGQCGGDQEVQGWALVHKTMHNLNSPKCSNNFGTKRPTRVEELGAETRNQQNENHDLYWPRQRTFKVSYQNRRYSQVDLPHSLQRGCISSSSNQCSLCFIYSKHGWIIFLV